MFIPAFLAAEAPADDAQALVAKYAAMVKGYSARVKAAEAQKKRLPLEETPTYLSVRIAQETRPEVRQVLVMARHFMFQSLEADLGKLPDKLVGFASTVSTSSMLELCGQIAPDSPALDLVAAVDPSFMGWIAWHRSGGGYVNQAEAAAAAKAFAFYDQVFEKHPSRQVKLMALESKIELYSRPRMLEEVKKGVAQLEAFEPASPAVPRWKKWLVTVAEEEKTAPKPGNAVPAFQVEDLDHPGTSISPATFKGKYWILDFWATWCSPCKGELPFVHKAYAKFHPAGLEILSVSSDLKAEDIAKFRKDPQHPMPWHHAFPKGQAKDALHRLFQVRGIPHVLLISPKGKILAMGDDLRKDNLERTLEKYLKTK
jgi:thiol-disulfide isomerase/thioredoxin